MRSGSSAARAASEQRKSASATWMRILIEDVMRRRDVKRSEAAIDERRVERRQHQQQHDEQRQRQRDQHIREKRFHRAAPNISASIFCACGSGIMNGTQPSVTQRNVTITLAARTARPSYHG